MLSTHGLAKGFGERLLFKGIGLHVRAGERLAVQGPSGSGKSTLGNILLGLLPPDRGRVQRAAGLARHALQKLYRDPVASFPPHVALERSLRDAAQGGVPGSGVSLSARQGA